MVYSSEQLGCHAIFFHCRSIDYEYNSLVMHLNAVFEGRF